MDKINGKGIVIGAVVWVALVTMVSSSVTCVKLGRCEGVDLLLLVIICAGMFVPAYIATLLFSGNKT